MNASTVRRAGLLVLGFVAGIAIAGIAFGRDDEPRASAPAASATTDPTLPETPAAPVPPGGAPASDPAAAVAAFLQAEADGDFRASWGLLAADDRARYVTVDRWVAAHESILPVTGFELAAAPASDPAAVPVRLRLRAGLDGVLGLVPAEAESSWVAVPEDGGWRVAFGRTSATPVLLDDAGAPTAAAEWVAARQACDADAVAALEHPTLVGTTGVADRLCGADEATAADAIGPLPAADAPRFVSAFGPDATTWARVVGVDGSTPLRAVLAPVGDRWLVVGVLPPALR
jgi:hypothetical protein